MCSENRDAPSIPRRRFYAPPPTNTFTDLRRHRNQKTRTFDVQSSLIHGPLHVDLVPSTANKFESGSSIACTIKCLTDNLDRCTQPQIDIPRVVLRKVLTRQWSVYGHCSGSRVCILVCGWIILGKHWDWDTGWTMNVNTGQQGSNTFIFIPHHIVLHCFSLIGMNLIVWTMERLYHVTIALFDGLQTNLLQCARRQPPDDPKPKHFLAGCLHYDEVHPNHRLFWSPIREGLPGRTWVTFAGICIFIIHLSPEFSWILTWGRLEDSIWIILRVVACVLNLDVKHVQLNLWSPKPAPVAN